MQWNIHIRKIFKTKSFLPVCPHKERLKTKITLIMISVGGQNYLLRSPAHVIKRDTTMSKILQLTDIYFSLNTILASRSA